MQDSIDIERLEDAWEQAKRFENYTSNTEFYNYIKSLKDANIAIGDPTPAMLEQLTEEQVSKVLAISEVWYRLEKAGEEGRLPPGIEL